MLSNLIDRIKLPFRKEKELYFALYNILGFYPRNITFYKVALMHKSLGHRATQEELQAIEGKNPKGNGGKKGDTYKSKGGKGKGKLGKQLNNERLEFLGDAILDAVVGDIVYQRYPGKPEGFLTNARSKMVQRETLGRLAKEMGITKLILASGRASTHNSYMGGNAFEALVGAVYLDRGYAACQKFWTERVMGKYLNVDKVAFKEVNFKSKLLEWSQKNRINIEFRLEDQSQDKHGSPKFIYTVVLEDVDGCQAEGFSKKESQQKACEMTLKKLRNEKSFLDSIFAAKTRRTQMDEDPTMVVPEVETVVSDDFIIQRDIQGNTPAPQLTESAAVAAAEQSIDSLSFDDVTAEATQKSREDIIAEAEAKAYNS